MIPILQRHESDCFGACVASILEVPYDSLPFCRHKTHAEWVTYLHRLDAWLHDRGLFALEVALGDSNIREAWHIVTGPGSRGVDHSVVYYHDQLKHDPHHLGKGLDLRSKDKWTYTYFVQIDPALQEQV